MATLNSTGWGEGTRELEERKVSSVLKEKNMEGENVKRENEIEREGKRRREREADEGRERDSHLQAVGVALACSAICSV